MGAMKISMKVMRIPQQNVRTCAVVTLARVRGVEQVEESVRHDLGENSDVDESWIQCKVLYTFSCLHRPFFCH
jgi:hypothetical protein